MPHWAPASCSNEMSTGMSLFVGPRLCYRSRIGDPRHVELVYRRGGQGTIRSRWLLRLKDLQLQRIRERVLRRMGNRSIFVRINVLALDSISGMVRGKPQRGMDESAPFTVFTLAGEEVAAKLGYSRFQGLSTWMASVALTAELEVGQ